MENDLADLTLRVPLIEVKTGAYVKELEGMWVDALRIIKITSRSPFPSIGVLKFGLCI